METSRATDYFLKNPFCILGLSCNAKKIEIIKAQEKINKLSKLGVEKSYKTNFCSIQLPEIDRSAGIIQTTIVKLDDLSQKIFWFEKDIYVNNFSTDEKINKVDPSQLENLDYDKFLAIYLKLLLCDTHFANTNLWKNLFNYIDFILKSDENLIHKIFVSRFEHLNPKEIMSILHKNILLPLMTLSEEIDIKGNLKLYALSSEFSAKEFLALNNYILEQLISSVELQCSFSTKFINSVGDISKATKSQLIEAAKIATNLAVLCKDIVNPILCMNLNDETFNDRLRDIVFKEFNNLCNLFAFGKNYKNAYICAKYANQYAPDYKKSEINHTLKTVKGLKEGYEAVKIARENRLLDSEDELLLNHNDISIQMLAMKAVAGDVESQCILGNIYKTRIFERNAPIDIPYNVAKGVRWIRESAKKGYGKAQVGLSACYISGDGVKQDIAKADYWLNQAAESGEEEAISFVKDYRYKELLKKSKGIGWGSVVGALILFWPIGVVMLIVKLVQLSMFNSRRCADE